MTIQELPTRRERKKAATRERIIEEATRLFRSAGYQATTIEHIADAADVAPRTFYSYFSAKVDVALSQFELWADDYLLALEERPAEEAPDVMLIGVARTLQARGYLTSERLRDADGRPYPPIGVAVVLSETEPEVAGRMHQVIVASQNRMAALFRRRLGYPEGAIEPRVIAAAVTASWFVAVRGYADVVVVDPDPPSAAELAQLGFSAFTGGLAGLWDGRVGGQSG
jgi:AcrR family transcriptional regulator